MLLAKLDDREKVVEYNIQQMLAESTLAIEIAEARAEEYKAELDTAIRLFKSRAMSEEERRLAEVRWKINKLEADREKENHKVEQLKAELLKIQLGDHRIVSPMKGIVQKVYKREKEALSIADGLELFRIVDPDVVWVEGDVPIKYLYRVRRGLQVEVQPQYFDSERKRVDLPQAKMKFRGRITFVDPEIQLVHKTFMVRAEVVNTGHVLRKGLSAVMTIMLGPAERKEPRRVAQRRRPDPLRPSHSGFRLVAK
jgi:multidrug resistance efflux pump